MLTLCTKLSDDVLSSMNLDTSEYTICPGCRKVKICTTQQASHSVVWDMSQEEWDRGNISLNELLKKGQSETRFGDCEFCQENTMKRRTTVISKSPQRLFINLNRATRLDRDVANAQYFIHDEETLQDIITYPVTCPRVLEYSVKTVSCENSTTPFHERTVRYSLQGVACVIIQQEHPNVQCHYVCHCIDDKGKWVHYDDYISKESDLFKENQDEFVSNSVAALFYKRMTNSDV